MEQRGVFPDVKFCPTLKSYKNLQYLLPWWKKTRKQDESFLDEYSVSKYLLSDIDRDVVAQSDEAPSTSQDTETLSPYRRAKKAFSKYAIRVKSGMKKLKGESDIDKLAVKFLFKTNKKVAYFEKINKCSNTESDWFLHYDRVVSNAFAFESTVGAQTAIPWALCCLKAMPERISNHQCRLELLVKLLFVWYNFALELRLRCAVDEEEVEKLFYMYIESFEKLIVVCQIDEDNKLVLDLFLKLIKAALINKICTDINLEGKYALKDFQKHKDIMHIPHILLGLYYYELALMAYSKNDVAAIDHLKLAFHHINGSCIDENLKWKYMFNVIYDATRFYSQLDSERKKRSKELYEIIHSTLEHEASENDMDTSFELHLHLALCYLAKVLEKKEADKNLVKIQDIIKSINYQESRFFELTDLVNLMHFNTLALYATAVYPYFTNIKEASETNSFFDFMFECIEVQKYGYKLISTATFYLVSNQYHSNNPVCEVVLAERLLGWIDLDYANQEILSYYLITKLMKGICFYRKNYPDEGRRLTNVALNSFFRKATFYDLARAIHKCINGNNLCQEVAENFIRDNEINKVSKAIVAVAGDQLRKKFPSKDEYTRLLIEAFSNFATAAVARPPTYK